MLLGSYEVIGKGEVSESGWFGKALAVKAARQAVIAWATAVNGDETELAALADLPERVSSPPPTRPS